MSSDASEGEIQDSVKEVSVNTKKKKKLYNLNNYSTNKEELLIEKMFESKFSMLKLNEQLYGLRTNFNCNYYKHFFNYLHILSAYNMQMTLHSFPLLFEKLFFVRIDNYYHLD